MAAFAVGKASYLNIPATLGSEGMVMKDLYDSRDPNNKQAKVEVYNDLVGDAVGTLLASAESEWKKVPVVPAWNTNIRKKTADKIKDLLCE
ncbi:MAG TPA: hypothetical protein VGD31_05060 [Sphingobacteriaceae bacterium]|jgi:hypothetical protein